MHYYKCYQTTALRSYSKMSLASTQEAIKSTDGQKREKALIFKYPGSESFCVIIGLSSKRFYTFTIK